MRVIVNDNIFKVKVCLTPETIQKGMMNQKFNENFNGMLFILPENGPHSFWMKNCIVPLDIIFLNDSKEITSIHKNCQPCNSKDCENFNGNGSYVLEIAGGVCDECGIEVGQKVNFVI